MRRGFSAVEVDKYYVTAARKEAYNLLKECSIANKIRLCKAGPYMSVKNKASEDLEKQVITDSG